MTNLNMWKFHTSRNWQKYLPSLPVLLSWSRLDSLSFQEYELGPPAENTTYFGSVGGVAVYDWVFVGHQEAHTLLIPSWTIWGPIDSPSRILPWWLCLFSCTRLSLSLYIYLLHILLFFREDTLVLTNTVCHLVTMHYIFHMSYPEFTSMDSSSFSTPLTPPQILIPYILIIFSPKSSALTSPEDESQSQWSLGVDGAPEGLDKWKAILALVTSFLLKIWWGYIRIGVGDWNSKCSLAKVWLYSFDSLG